MYHNDHIKFLINNHYTEPIWITKGVKQGYGYSFVSLVYNNFVLGCNLSPLLFSIFIDSLGYELNNTNLGISLGTFNISSIFFADDIVIVGKNRSALDKLMDITRKFFKSHHLELSINKSKILSHEATLGEINFPGGQELSPITLEQVVCFKYLGVTVSSSP